MGVLHLQITKEELAKSILILNAIFNKAMVRRKKQKTKKWSDQILLHQFPFNIDLKVRMITFTLSIWVITHASFLKEQHYIQIQNDYGKAKFKFLQIVTTIFLYLLTKVCSSKVAGNFQISLFHNSQFHTNWHQDFFLLSQKNKFVIRVAFINMVPKKWSLTK